MESIGTFVSGLKYRKLWVGNTVSNLSDGLIFIITLLIAIALGEDPLTVSGLTVVYAVPQIDAMLGIDVMIDHFDRRHPLYMMNLLRFLVYDVPAILLIKGTVNLPLLYIIYATMTLVKTISGITVLSIFPSIIPARELNRVNSQITGVQLIVDGSAGPPLGGFLFVVVAALPAGTSSFACSIASPTFFLLWGSCRDNEAGAERTSIWSDLNTSLAWLRRNEVVTGLVVISGLVSVACSLPLPSLVVFTQHILGLDNGSYGLTMSFSTSGRLLGNFISSRLRQRFGYGTSMVLALFLGAVSITTCGATSDPSIAAATITAYIYHAAVWSVLVGPVWQEITSQDLSGRIRPAGRLLSYLDIVTGAAVGGWMAATLDLRVPFYLFGLRFLDCIAISARLHGTIRAWESTQDKTTVTE